MVTARCAARLERGTVAFCLSGAIHRGALKARLIMTIAAVLYERSYRKNRSSRASAMVELNER